MRKKKMQLIEVSSNVHKALIEIKYKNRCESISDTIAEMMLSLKEYQNET